MCVCVVSVYAELTVISSHPKWKDSILASPDSVGSAVEMGASQLLGLFFWNHSPGTRKEPLDVPPLLGTRSGHPVRWVLSMPHPSPTHPHTTSQLLVSACSALHRVVISSVPALASTKAIVVTDDRTRVIHLN